MKSTRRSSRKPRHELPPAGATRGRVGGTPRQRRTRVARAPEPEFAALSRGECERVLARNNVGRLAFSFHDRVDIEPIHYVFADGWLYGRTSPGSKLVPMAHNHWVAFEVDEIDDLFQWRSVVVHGAFYPVSPDGPEREAAAWEAAIVLLRRIVPETWTRADPVAFRTVVFRIHIDSMTGRAATRRTPEEGQ